jgi:hypothetical protein
VNKRFAKGWKMKKIEFSKAFYIKLGAGGIWEESSISENKARIGWKNLTLEEINNKNWDSIRQTYLNTYKTIGAATMDINALRNIVESTSDDIWITFHASQLWWGRFSDASHIQEDTESKYRVLDGKWQNHDINGNPLLINQISGRISKVQGFRATVCKISGDDEDDLKRLINDVPSDDYNRIARTRDALIKDIELGLKKLHWKDFELLTDLIFRNAGWHRLSLVGETLKYVDMELQEPITNELYQVQVKSQATLGDFEKYARDFSHGSFRKLYFVVHSPDKNLVDNGVNLYRDVELILPDKLAKMVVEFGLTEWLLKKIK